MDIDQELNKAIRFHESGKLKEAKEIYTHILTTCPDHSVSSHLLGLIALVQGEHDHSAALIHRAIQSDPENHLYYNSLGDVFSDHGKLKAAIACYQKALKLKPDFADAYLNMAKIFYDQDNYDQAIACYEKALKLKPDFAQAYFNMAKVFHVQGNFEEAVPCCQKALVLDPNMFEAYYNMGTAYQENGNYDEAITCYQEALRINPDFAQAHNNMGVAYQEQKNLDKAIACYQKALQSRPDHEDACHNMGKALCAKGLFDQAIAYCQETIRLNPESTGAYNTMGISFHARGSFDEAIASYEKALQIDPVNADAFFNRSLTLLLRGNYSEGWKEYEWRLKTDQWERIYPHRYGKPRWDGSSFKGKRLLVHSEQGLGDILQFARYLPKVKARGGTVIFQTKKALIGLFKDFPGIDMTIGLWPDGKKPDVEFDLYISLLSLGAIFKTTLDSIPPQIPYFFAEPDKVRYWRSRLTQKGFKVGIVWAGTPTNPRRSCHLAKFVSLARIPGVHLYGLQKGVPAKQVEVEGLPQGMVMTNFGEDFEDFTDTAAMIQNLDLLISIDTSVAHLGGAMGKPVWTLLPFVPDWRWLLNREDSPWYPTMRLFRQKTPGDWDTVIQRITEELRTLIDNRLQTGPATNIQKTLDLANKHSQCGRIQAAEKEYLKILQSDPNHPDALHGLGLVAYQTVKLDIAVDLIHKAIVNSPRIPHYHYNMGLVFTALGQLEKAIQAFQEAANLKPDYADAHYNLGIALKTQGQYEVAAESFKRAILYDPRNNDAYYNLGNTLKAMEQHEDAIEAYQQVTKTKPDFAEAYNNLGLALKEQGHIEPALDHYNQAIRIKPDFAEAHWNRAIVLLLSGNFEEGWKEHEWRFLRDKMKTTYPYHCTIPRWDGSPFPGKKLFVHAEQGLGDTIHFIRYLPMVKARGGTLIFEAMGPLLGLLQGFPGIDELVEMSPNRSHVEKCHFYTPLLSLPMLLGTTLDTIPAQVPYLYAHSDKIAYWREQTAGTGFKVGFVWAGKPEYENDKNRSCALDHFLVLSEIPGVQLYGLQKGEAAAQADGIPEGKLIANLGERLQDFTDTAGVIENLDLVVSVDTAVAHLAGAMGKPTWTLLPFVPDWRWMLAREDSPWYPTMRLFRQERWGDWGSIFRRVSEELRNLIG